MRLAAKVAMIHALYEQMKPFKSCEQAFTSAQMNIVSKAFKLLDPLIHTTSAAEAMFILSQQSIARLVEPLHRLRAQYEIQAEISSALSLLDEADVKSATIAYMNRHLPLTSIHDPLFRQQVSGRKRCLLVGCGAFPSTAFLLLKQTNLHLVCLDSSAKSCQLAQSLLTIQWRDRVSVLSADIFDLTVFNDWDVIFISALACVDKREQLTTHLLDYLKPGTLLIFRSAYALGRLIYPTVDCSDFLNSNIQLIHAPKPGRSGLVLVSI